jgi:glycerophosphoryl diester phosphodiesterase
LERRVVAAIHAADVVARTRVRSFDHRSCAAIRMLEPTLATGLLVHNTAPVNIAHLLAAAGAKLYCPDYEFVDEHVVRQAKDAGACIIPYTVNTEDAWERLVDWGVDGITTDYPDRLIAWLCDRGVPIA